VDAASNFSLADAACNATGYHARVHRRHAASLANRLEVQSFARKLENLEIALGLGNCSQNGERPRRGDILRDFLWSHRHEYIPGKIVYACNSWIEGRQDAMINRRQPL
jgi:hypothetical protein